jgi:hypothetical protein
MSNNNSNKTMTEEECLAKIEEDPDFFRNISYEKLDNKEFVLKAIDVLPKGKSYLFRKLSESLKDDKDVALKIVAKSYECMTFISRRLMADKEVALVCLQQEGSSLQYVAYDLVDDLVENGVNDKDSALKYLEKLVIKEALDKELSSKEDKSKKLKI